jgi:hypothetical protein
MRNLHVSETPKVVFIFESMKREVKRRLIYEYRCDEGLKTKNEEPARLVDTKSCIFFYSRIKKSSRQYFLFLYYDKDIGMGLGLDKPK